MGNWLSWCVPAAQEGGTEELELGRKNVIFMFFLFFLFFDNFVCYILVTLTQHSFVSSFFFPKPSSLISAAYVANSWMCGDLCGQPSKSQLLFSFSSCQLPKVPLVDDFGTTSTLHAGILSGLSLYRFVRAVTTSPLRSYHDLCWGEYSHFCLFYIWTMTFICKAMVSTAAQQIHQEVQISVTSSWK